LVGAGTFEESLARGRVHPPDPSRNVLRLDLSNLEKLVTAFVTSCAAVDPVAVKPAIPVELAIDLGGDFQIALKHLRSLLVDSPSGL
jgi:hypothetical protein